MKPQRSSHYFFPVPDDNGTFVALRAIKAYGVVKIWLHLFLTSVLNRSVWSALYHGRFTFRERTAFTD
jgi:hypothetical protein